MAQLISPPSPKVPRLSDKLQVIHGLPEKGIKPGRLGLMALENFRYYVHNPDRSRNFYLNSLGFKEIAKSNSEYEKREGCTVNVYGAGHSRVEVASPTDNRSFGSRFLELHPDGVSNLVFRVRDLDYAEAFLRERGAAFIDEVPFDYSADGGTYRGLSIASPLGDVVFSFIERSSDYDGYAPGFERLGDIYPKSEFNYRFVDHITVNTLTMMPAVFFYKHIMGFEEYWSIQFHSSESMERQDWHNSSGLRSIVMWDPDSGIKFATNEPLAPMYRKSQIAKYCSDNFGNGVQHLALAVPEICDVVEELHRRKVLFLDSPDAYYDDLPKRMELKRIFKLDKPIDRLKDLGILLDGEDDHYLLQIFLRDSAAHYNDRKAGPFFYELIQRAGANGFGEGNFRALFDAIAKTQREQPLV